MQRAQVRARVRLRVGQRKGLGMISCVEHATLHFCSDAATARVANTPMQPPRAAHRLCEAYCQRPAGRSCPAAHATFDDVFFRGEPSAKCGRSGRAVGASRRSVRSWDAPRRFSCPAEASWRWPARRTAQHGALPKCVAELGIYARLHGLCCIGWFPVARRCVVDNLLCETRGPRRIERTTRGTNGTTL